MAFILTRTTAASISSASLSSCAAACWDFCAWGFSFGSCAKAGLTERKHATSAARIRPIIAVTPFRVRPRPAPLFCQYTKLLRASDKLRSEFSHERLARHEPLPQSRARARSPAHARFPHGGPRHGRGARRVLGVNGVFGNVGVAFSALIAGALADTAGWRAAFIVPGAIALAVGAAFAFFARESPGGTPTRRTGPYRISRADLARVFAVLTVATACGGVIFNATTISMPKVFEERLSALTHSTFGVGMLVCGVYLLAAMAQLCVGWWLDRRSLKAVFVPVVALQVPLLLAAGTTENALMLLVAVAMMFFVFGQIPINDAMIARYTAEAWRARAYAVRYVVSFTASALAVPLVAWLYRSSGDFRLLYFALGALALATFAAALFFPAEEGKTAAGELSA